jgi:hypothetical protein
MKQSFCSTVPQNFLIMEQLATHSYQAGHFQCLKTLHTTYHDVSNATAFFFRCVYLQSHCFIPLVNISKEERVAFETSWCVMF